MDKPEKKVRKKRKIKAGKFTKKEVEDLIESTMGSITAAAGKVGMPYTSFYSLMEKHGIRAYPDKIKRRVALMALDRAKYLALTPQNKLFETGDKADPSLVKEILKKWGKFIEFEEPEQVVNHHHKLDPWDVILNTVDPERGKDDGIETAGT